MPTKLSRPSKSSRPAARFQALLWLSVCLAAACSDLDPTSADGDAGEKKRRRSTPTSPPPDTSTTPTPTPAAPSSTNPFVGATLYVESWTFAGSTANSWRSTRPEDAALLDRIARTPQAVWFNGWHTDVYTAAATHVGKAAAAGALPVMVAYNIPQRDCGSYAAGGSSSAEAYLAWIRNFAAGIGSRGAVVILEPDALAGMGCLSTTDRERRLSLLSQAITIFKSNPATFVYLDAGHPRWISATEMANRLRAANIAAADGFSLNVSNFISNTDNVSYGATLSTLVGGKHFVIDTSRNGQGPTATYEWCNPSGRGLGVAPTAATGHPLVDALLWIKRPGESDGPCNGGPSSGKWWPEYALGLAQRATTLLALN